MRKTKKLNIIYNPLNISKSLLPRGGSLTQEHNAGANSYTPDRTLLPLTLEPVVYIDDPDNILARGRVTLSDVKWYAIPKEAAQIQNLNYLKEDLSQYLITAATEGYTIRTDGSLVVSRNTEYLHPIVLLYKACYMDPRDNHIYKVDDHVTLSTISVAVAANLHLDKPVSFTFDPLSDSGLRTITASVKFGGKDPDPRYCSLAYWWYKVINGQESLVDPDEDLFYESGQNTASLVVDPRYIDGRVRFVCKAEYALTGEQLPQAPTADCLTAETTLIREYARYDFEHVVYGGEQVAAGTRMVKNECIVTVGNKVLQSASEFFSVVWSILKAVRDAEEVILGYGDSIMIDSKELENGAYVSLDVEEFKPLKALAIDDDVLCIDGEVLTL